MYQLTTHIYVPIRQSGVGNDVAGIFFQFIRQLQSTLLENSVSRSYNRDNIQKRSSTIPIDNELINKI